MNDSSLVLQPHCAVLSTKLIFIASSTAGFLRTLCTRNTCHHCCTCSRRKERSAVFCVASWRSEHGRKTMAGY